MISMWNFGRYGRNGNMLFQFAVGLSLAISLDTDLVTPDWYCRYLLNMNSRWRGVKVPSAFNSKIFFRAISFLSRPRIVYDGNDASCFFGMTEGKKNIELVGYFQSPDFFKKHEEIVIKALSPKGAFGMLIEKISSKYAFNERTSLHVRRGDYLGKLNVHPVCEKSYYQQAMERVGVRPSKLAIFTDDPDWCVQQEEFDGSLFINDLFDSDVDLKKINGLEFGCINNQEWRSWFELYLMTRFKNNIIANSSFSWWGAYLNKNVERVVAPKKWFGEKGTPGVSINKLLLPQWEVI